MECSLEKSITDGDGNFLADRRSAAGPVIEGQDHKIDKTVDGTSVAEFANTTARSFSCLRNMSYLSVLFDAAPWQQTCNGFGGS